jgi:hypothetical protein
MADSPPVWRGRSGRAAISKRVSEISDYFLFMRGKLAGRILPYRKRGAKIALPDRHGTASYVGETAIRKWFLAAERAAEVPHVEGRGAYGVRRAALDALLDLDRSPEEPRRSLTGHRGSSAGAR